MSTSPFQLGEGWWERTDPGLGAPLPRSRHFRIRSDLPPEQTRRYAELLDTMHGAYRRVFQGLRLRGREEPVVFMFASEDDYRRTLRVHAGVLASTSSGMFFVGPRGSGLAFYADGVPQERVERLIRSEGFKLIADLYFDGDLPPWVCEGFAASFADAMVIDGAVVDGEPSPAAIARMREIVEQDRTIALQDLLARDAKSWSNAIGGGGSAAADQAASIIDFLRHGEGGRLASSLASYLRQLNDGRDASAAFRDSFGGSDDRMVADLERRWRDFVIQRRPGSFRAAAERLRFLAEGLLFLRDRGIRPTSLDGLQTALVEQRFEADRTGAGDPARPRAGDADLMAIPVDALQVRGRQPIFVLTAKEARAERRRDEDKVPPPNDEGGGRGAGGTDDPSSETAGRPATAPPPPELSTRNLKPRDLRIVWGESSNGHWQWQLRLK